jgi:integrase
LDNGVTPKILSDRIGHSDIRVTFQVYGHRSTSQDREAAELVAKLIREALELPIEP